MTTTTTDVHTLYDTNSDFRSFIAFYVEHRRCPLALCDFLIEQGLEAAAEFVRWAATEEDRFVYEPVIEAGERGGKCGPFPTLNNGIGAEFQYWFWSPISNFRSLEMASDFHRHCVEVNEDVYGQTFKGCTEPKDAILKLMDMWVVK
jgi:hypothetical protein